jgi:hypothetical protein
MPNINAKHATPKTVAKIPNRPNPSGLRIKNPVVRFIAGPLSEKHLSAFRFANVQAAV